MALLGGATFRQLTAGGNHTCGLTVAGVAWCWGRDDWGQLGNGVNANDQVNPTPVDTTGALPDHYSALTAGFIHSCGLTGAGTAWCWGTDDRGRLGNGGTSGQQNSPSPVDMAPLSGATFSSVTAAEGQSCGVTGAGVAWCWGNDDDGQLGNGAISGDQVSPNPVDASGLPGGTTFTEISAKSISTCGLTAAGTVWCWGNDDIGQLGNGATSGDQSSPSPVDTSVLPLGTTFTALSDEVHSCGLTGSGTVYCWGKDDNGQAGNGAISGVQPSPGPVDASNLPPGTAFTAVVNGDNHSCGLTGSGTAWCWGPDDNGRLGNGSVSGDQPSPSPVDMAPLAGAVFTALTAGSAHTCGLSGAGTAFCWGNDDVGQLGNGAVAGDQPSPGPVDMAPVSGATFTALAAGDRHTCGLTDAGTAYCWGDDSQGQLGDGAPSNDQASPSPVDMAPLGAARFTALAGGGLHTCGSGSGTAWCWGEDDDGQLGNGAIAGDQLSPSQVDMAALGGATFTTVATGFVHSCGVTGAGTAFCWGSDGFGRLGNGAGPTADQASPSAVDFGELPAGTTYGEPAPGFIHSCGLTTTGTAACWGNDTGGRLGNGAAAIDDEPSPTLVDLGVAITVADRTAAAASMVTFTAVAQGVGPVSYAWTRNGTPIPGETHPTLTFTVAPADHGAVYAATVTNAFASSANDGGTLFRAPAGSAASSAAAARACADGGGGRRGAGSDGRGGRHRCGHRDRDGPGDRRRRPRGLEWRVGLRRRRRRAHVRAGRPRPRRLGRGRGDRDPRGRRASRGHGDRHLRPGHGDRNRDRAACRRRRRPGGPRRCGL